MTIVVVFIGGTIAMRFDPEAGGRMPALSAHETLARSALGQDVELLDRGSRPSSHLSLADTVAVALDVREQLRRPDVSGAVVVQGTDTLEETGFAFDLLLDSEKPLVVTGAMRAADEPLYDGPQNVRDAVLAASSPALIGQGAVVCMAGSLFAADDVVKAHATAIDAFRAPNFGPLGHVSAGKLVTVRRRLRRRHVFTTRAEEDVMLVKAALGETGAMLRSAAGEVSGLVVEAFGTGQTHPALLEATRPLLACGCPVVLTTRTWAGAPQPLYAYDGGAIAWRDAGAILAGHLDGPKARVALSLGLGARLEHTLLRDLLADPPDDADRTP